MDNHSVNILKIYYTICKINIILVNIKPCVMRGTERTVANLLQLTDGKMLTDAWIIGRVQDELNVLAWFKIESGHPWRPTRSG